MSDAMWVRGYYGEQFVLVDGREVLELRTEAEQAATFARLTGLAPTLASRDCYTPAGQRCALCHFLAHAQHQYQCRHYNYTTANAYHAGHKARHQAG